MEVILKCMLMVSACPYSIKLAPLGQGFSIQVSHLQEWEFCFKASSQSLDPVSQSLRRHCNLRVRFQQNSLVYVVLAAQRYLLLPCFSHPFQDQLGKSFQGNVSSSTCCLAETYM